MSSNGLLVHLRINKSWRKYTYFYFYHSGDSVSGKIKTNKMKTRNTHTYTHTEKRKREGESPVTTSRSKYIQTKGKKRYMQAIIQTVPHELIGLNVPQIKTFL